MLRCPGRWQCFELCLRNEGACLCDVLGVDCTFDCFVGPGGFMYGLLCMMRSLGGM